MKVEFLKGDLLAKVFVGGTNNPDLDGIYATVFDGNVSETPTAFDDGAGFDLTPFTTYDLKTLKHTLYDVKIDVTKNVYDNKGNEYVKIVLS